MALATSEASPQVGPIPAFYCCYLLRSSKQPGSMYIGSTPNPARRLEQHNGVTTGGAKRTQAGTMRPWHMIAIVEGFTSRTGALQFEWSWQHMYICRHIDIVESDTMNKRRKDGTAGKKPGLPRSVAKILGNLHQLLRSVYFRTWPLTVRFLSIDAYGHWQRWTERVDGLLPDNMQVKLDFQAEGASILNPSLPANDMSHIDVSYSGLKEHLDKSLALLGDSTVLLCEVCKKHISVQSDVIVVCSQRTCRSASHIMCLSQLFLDESGSSELVPTIGDCPACKKENVWADLMKELTFRLSGGRAVTAPPKLKRTRKGSKKASAISNNTKASSDDNGFCFDAAADDDLDESWIDTVDFASDPDEAAGSTGKSSSRIEIVIEDSEAEDLDIFD